MGSNPTLSAAVTSFDGPAVLAGSMLVQHVATGAVVLNTTTGAATYTDGAQFWTPDGYGNLNDSTDAPPGVLPALLASAPGNQTISQPTAAPAPTSAPTPTTLSEADVAARAEPSVVQIRVPDGGASGIVIASNGKRVHAQLLRSDATRDLALLSAPDLNLPPLQLEPAAQQRQGDSLLVLGYPLSDLKELGGQAALTRGLLCVVRTQANGVTLVQTDAPINPRSIGVTLAELPNGGSGWTKLDEDTSRLDTGIDIVTFGKTPTNNANFGPDPLLIVYVAAGQSAADRRRSNVRSAGRPRSYFRSAGDLTGQHRQRRAHDGCQGQRAPALTVGSTDACPGAATRARRLPRGGRCVPC